MFDLRGLIFDVKKRSRPRCAPRTSTIKHQTSNILLTSTIKHPPSNIHGLTLIELLVVIVILTTLVAGVIPVLSPNNDTRKIREATRMLQTYIVMAQAEAARTGRPHGISFRESSPGSGVALDVYQIAVPPVFSGFSSNSRVTVTTGPLVYNPGASSAFKFHPLYNNYPLYDLGFVLAATSGPDPDLFPPRMLQVGDQINVEGNVFLIVDDTENAVTSDFLDSDSNLRCIWLNHTGQLPPQGMKRYQFQRQPTAAAGFAVTPGATAEAPLQLPSSIGIDMQGSITEGNGDIATRFPTAQSLYTNPTTADTVGIMFSPTGGVSSVFLNGNPLTNVSRLVLLLGRVENGGLTAAAEWTIATGASNDELSQLQERINWLNLDTRWLSIATNSGRVVVTENAFVDTRSLNDLDNDGDPGNIDPDDQIKAAHEFAHEMKSTGAGR